MERSTTENLVARYLAGESVRVIAGATGVPATTVHRRLVSNEVELRSPGRQPAALERTVPPPLSAMPTPILPGPRAARLRAGAGRGSNPRPPVRPTRARAGEGSVPAAEVLDGLRRGLAAFRADIQAPLELDDHELQVFAEGMAILAGKQPLVDASGNTRGVRLGADGQPERH